jgi:hypothetical protein
MIVQAVCFPVGSKMLVIPTFFPIIPFMILGLVPARLLGQFEPIMIRTSIPVCHRPFPFWGSTGSKQTLNGLFYVKKPALFF